MQTEGGTDMTELIVTFHNFANVPNKKKESQAACSHLA
jgi:hypothetical protein